MIYAIFDTAAGVLYWMDEADSPFAAVKAMQEENGALNHSDQDPGLQLITVYALEDSEVARVDEQLASGEHISQNFQDPGQEFNLAQLRQIFG